MMTGQRFDEIFDDVGMALYRPARIPMEMGCPRHGVAALKDSGKGIVSLLGLAHKGFASFLPVKGNGKERKPLEWLVGDMDGTDMFIGEDDKKRDNKTIAKGSLLSCHIKALASCISQDKTVGGCKTLDNKGGRSNCLMGYNGDDSKISIDMEGGKHIDIGVDKPMGILAITGSGAKKFDFSRIVTVSGHSKTHSMISVDKDDKSMTHSCLPQLEGDCHGSAGRLFDNIKFGLRDIGRDSYRGTLEMLDTTMNGMMDYMPGTGLAVRAKLPFDGKEWRDCTVKDTGGKFKLQVLFEDGKCIGSGTQGTYVTILTHKMAGTPMEWLEIGEGEVHGLIGRLHDGLARRREMLYKSENYKLRIEDEQ